MADANEGPILSDVASTGSYDDHTAGNVASLGLA